MNCSRNAMQCIRNCSLAIWRFVMSSNSVTDRCNEEKERSREIESANQISRPPTTIIDVRCVFWFQFLCVCSFYRQECYCPPSVWRRRRRRRPPYHSLQRTVPFIFEMFSFRLRSIKWIWLIGTSFDPFQTWVFLLWHIIQLQFDTDAHGIRKYSCLYTQLHDDSVWSIEHFILRFIDQCGAHLPLLSPLLSSSSSPPLTTFAILIWKQRNQ